MTFLKILIVLMLMFLGIYVGTIKYHECRAWGRSILYCWPTR